MLYTGEKGLSLSFNGNVNESQYKSDLPGILDIEEGDRINSVPKLTLASSASYRFPIGEKLNGLVFGNLQYNSEREDITPGKVIYAGDKITTVTARAGVEAKNWGLFLFANNLTNENGSLQRSALSPIDSRLRPRSICKCERTAGLAVLLPLLLIVLLLIKPDEDEARTKEALLDRRELPGVTMAC